MLSRIILGLLVCFFSFSAFAQSVQELTLEESINLALEKNPGYQSAKKELSKAKAGVAEAYSNLLPQISASANLQHSWDIQTQRVPNFLKPIFEPFQPLLPPGTPPQPDYIEFAFGLENMLMYGVNLQQPLFLGGAGWAGVQIAKAAERASTQNLEMKKQNLVYQTVNAFYGVLLAQEVVKVQEEALRQTEANLDVVTKKYNAGTASRFDKMRAEVNVANSKPQAISARNAYQMALTGFRLVLGATKDEPFDVKGELTFVNDDFADASLKTLQNKAIANRPEAIALQDQIYMARKGVTIAKSQFMPKMFFQTDYSFMNNFNDADWGGLKHDDFSKGFTSTVSVSVPLFTSLKNVKGVQKAKLDYHISQDVEQQALDGILSEVEVAFNSFHEAFEKYDAANESVSLAEESYRLANMMYEEGASTQLDVWSAQLALTQARLNYLSSLYEYQMARYQLRKVTGNLNGIL